MDKSVFTPEYQLFLVLLREVRSESSLTQVQLAKKLDETQSWISKCERGEHRLDIVELIKFCDALEISMAQFVTRLEARIATQKNPL